MRAGARSAGSRRLLRLAFVSGLLSFTATLVSAAGLRIRSDLSPENRRRAQRPETRHIVLHTTEGREAGSLRKLRARGEAHYFVHRDGRVVRLLDRSRIATHAGRSMWQGRNNLDELSLGIEVSGYHQREPTQAQFVALRELLRQLQSLYQLSDENVLTHSMVAYGAPNRFHPYDHRGRKRCAMVFALPEVRRRLGLLTAPGEDPDVRAGRLRVGDPELQGIIYPAPARTARAEPAARPVAEPRASGGAAEDSISLERTAWSIARGDYASATTLYVFPDGTRTRGDAILQWDEMPPGTRVLLDQPVAAASADPSAATATLEPVDGLLHVGARAAARDLLGGAAVASTTTYLFPSGAVRTGAELDRDQEGRRLLSRLPPGTRVLVGYVNGGRLTSNRSLQRIAGRRWNYPSTYYRLPDGRIRAGVEIDDTSLPTGTLVFFRQ